MKSLRHYAILLCISALLCETQTLKKTTVLLIMADGFRDFRQCFHTGHWADPEPRPAPRPRHHF